MARRPLPPLVLAYHGVAAVKVRDDPSLLFVPPRDVVRHIRRLRRWGYELLGFGAMADRIRNGNAAGCASLTFDDGFVDNLEQLAPLLDAEGAPATVFVPSGWLGRTHPYAPQTRVMTAAEVRELNARGVEIGAHTHSHPDLTTLPYDEAVAELRRGKQELEELLGVPVETLAYPYGRVNEETRRASREAGFVAACRTCGEGNWSDPLDIPRQDMTNASTMLGLRLKRDDRYERLVGWRPLGLARAARRRLLAAAGR
jgi:peptidoglycan/xylan/chitin deacetylase (PgdA/CDA1 family)